MKIYRLAFALGLVGLASTGSMTTTACSSSSSGGSSGGTSGGGSGSSSGSATDAGSSSGGGSGSSSGASADAAAPDATGSSSGGSSGSSGGSGSSSGGFGGCTLNDGTYTITFTASASNGQYCPAAPSNETLVWPPDSGGFGPDCTCSGSTLTCTKMSTDDAGVTTSQTTTIMFNGSSFTGTDVGMSEGVTCDYTFTGMM